MSNKDPISPRYFFRTGKIILQAVIIGFAFLLLGCTQSLNQVNSIELKENIIPQAKPAKSTDQANISPSDERISTLEAPPSPTPVPTSQYQSTPIPPPALDNPLLESFVQEAQEGAAALIHLSEDNTGIWQFPKNSFSHPVAVEIHQRVIYLIDKGRVLTVNIDNPTTPSTLLEPGEYVENVLVLETLDLGLTSTALLVLDRAGDVYRFDFAGQVWKVDRYDRPVEESSGHYFVALDGMKHFKDEAGKSMEQAALLETNYKFTMTYNQDSTSIWNLPEARGIDLSTNDDDVFVLQRSLHDSSANLLKFNNTRLVKEFDPNIEMERPRQVVATESAVYVLDQAGQRLRALDPQNGALLRVYQLPQEDPPSTFTVTSNDELIFTSRDRIYFLNQPGMTKSIGGNLEETGIQPHDPRFLAALTDFTVPIGGSNITFRDFQLPGAPRHYRLGIHQGIDFYWQPGTKVLATAAGTVIRADNEYVPPTSWQLGAWWAESQENGFTSLETLDKYLGRQVWIEHDGGLVSRYAHLSSIAPGIEQGAAVEKGEVIGEVGNSGSPSSLESDSADAHLHFELWFGDHYLGQYLRPIEVREWVEQILKN